MWRRRRTMAAMRRNPAAALYMMAAAALAAVVPAAAASRPTAASRTAAVPATGAAATAASAASAASEKLPTAGAVIVAGLGGSDQYSRLLSDWASRFHAVLTARCGIPADRVVVLTETPDAAAAPPRRKSTAADLKAAMEEMARPLRPQDQFILFIAGHGQIHEESGKLALPGRDITAAGLGDLIDAVPARRIVIINCASGGADFLRSYLRPGRVIITAAGYETEGAQTYFAEFFVRGLETGQADADADGAIDLLEAYVYGARETANFYHRQHLLEQPDLGRDVKPTPGKVYWLVRGKETRAIWRKLYAGTDNILARPQNRRDDDGNLTDGLPADLDAESDPTPQFGRYDKHWHFRRLLAEHARLDDSGAAKDAFFLWKPYAFQEVPQAAGPGQTGYLARLTFLTQAAQTAQAAQASQPSQSSQASQAAKPGKAGEPGTPGLSGPSSRPAGPSATSGKATAP